MRSIFSNFRLLLFNLILIPIVSCSTSNEPIPGPDKQGLGLLSGGLLGAGSGMVTGAQFGSPTGPGMFIGAAFGAVWGGVTGLGIDLLEDEELKLLAEVDHLHKEVWIQNVLISHHEKKKELHPGRDIFPADDFFKNGDYALTFKGELLAQAIAKRYSDTNSYSSILITSYQKSSKNNKKFSSYLGKKRTQVLANVFALTGLEPRRIKLKTVNIGSPLVYDPFDSPERYSHALEFTLLDK